MKKTLNDIADDVIQKLSGRVIIHRYDAYSTNSIYLKFDYGSRRLDIGYQSIVVSGLKASIDAS